MNPPDPVVSMVEPIVGTLRVADGRRLKDTVPCAMAQNPPSQAARARRGERLFLLLDLTGPVSSHLYRELREVVAQTYWSSTGSITAALRLAAAAVDLEQVLTERELIRAVFNAESCRRGYLPPRHCKPGQERCKKTGKCGARWYRAFDA